MTSKGPSCSHKYRFLKIREMGWISNRGYATSKTHLDIGDFEESRKIKYLVSKLMGPAGDFVEQYRLDHPVEASCYKTLKRALKDRFMGKNIEYKYQTSYNNCKRKAG